MANSESGTKRKKVGTREIGILRPSQIKWTYTVWTNLPKTQIPTEDTIGKRLAVAGETTGPTKYVLIGIRQADESTPFKTKTAVVKDIHGTVRHLYFASVRIHPSVLAAERKRAKAQKKAQRKKLNAKNRVRPKIKCLICKKEFLKLTPMHMIKMHDITMGEYHKKHG